MIDQHTLVMAAVLAASALAFLMGRMSFGIFPGNDNNQPKIKAKRKTGKRKSTPRSPVNK